ncbi:MAG: alpha/beta hydrolase-fold protein [Thermoguttaceae bacterium]
MRCVVALFLLSFSTIGFAADSKGPSPDDQYKKLTPDSEEQPGVPKGRLETFTWDTSTIFPGTTRKVTIYVPAQYDPAKPAAVFVCQDGVLYRAPTVFDNLIARKEMPVTIGIFIQPGDFPLKPGEKPRKRPDGRPAPRANRSKEYDTLSDAYSRFLLEEILPEVAKRYNLTKDPEGRCIAGSSSGGICAFTVCWQRPDQFRKCFTTVGSFTNIRGGNQYPDLVLAASKKPIRIFQQDGANDIVNQYGSWPEANKAMAKALAEKGYDHQFVFGEGVHSSHHGTQIFPDAMRWMWRDYPK